MYSMKLENVLCLPEIQCLTELLLGPFTSTPATHCVGAAAESHNQFFNIISEWINNLFTIPHSPPKFRSLWKAFINQIKQWFLQLPTVHLLPTRYFSCHYLWFAVCLIVFSPVLIVHLIHMHFSSRNLLRHDIKSDENCNCWQQGRHIDYSIFRSG